MHVVTMLNQKGGVGKTSTTHHLAGAMAAKGLRVLLIDNDPQSSLTQGFWGPKAGLSIDPAETVAALYRGDDPEPAKVIKATGIPGLDLLPGSESATEWNIPRPERAPADSRRCIRAFLEEVDGYDLAFIDCPPNLHLCSWAALVGSDSIVVPAQPEDYGAQGLASVLRSVAMVQAEANPALRVLGFLLTRVGKSKAIHQIYEADLREIYGERVFAARIPDLVAYVEAIANRKPIQQYKPKGAPAQAIRDVADELLARIAALAAGTDTTTREVA